MLRDEIEPDDFVSTPELSACRGPKGISRALCFAP